MRIQPPTANTHHDLDELTVRLLVALEQEEATLLVTSDHLRQVHAALRGGDSSALTTALAGQAQAAQAAEGHTARRRGLCREWASALHTSLNSITLTLLADQLPQQAGARVLYFRDRLRQLAAEADELNRANAVLAGHCLDFMQRLLADVTGAADSRRYGPTGAQLTRSCGSLIEARG